jgi:hypothetical protein
MKALDKVNWRRELVFLGLVGMEATWLTAFFLTLVQPSAEQPSTTTALLTAFLLLVATYLARASIRWHAAPRLHWGIMTASLLIALALVLGLRLLPVLTDAEPFHLELTQVMTALLLIAIWWRGNTLAHLDVTAPNLVMVHFWLGLSVFLLIIILGETLLGQLSAVKPQAELPPATQRIVGFIPIYFLFSLVTLAVARIEEVTQLPESTASAPQPRFWLAFITGTAILIVVAGLLLSLFFTGGGLAWSLGWVPPILKGVGQVLQLVGVTLVLIIGALFSLLTPLLEQIVSLLPFGRLKEVFNVLLENLNQLEQQLQEMEANQASGELWGVLARYAVVAIFILALICVGRTVRRRQRQKKTLVQDQSQATSLAGDAKDDSLFQRGLKRLTDRLRDGLHLFRALTIRRIYANLQRLATQRGYPRQPYQTPSEYVSLLLEAWPHHETEVRTITSAYERAHYGQVPDSHEELKRIQEAWQRIRASAL